MRTFITILLSGAVVTGTFATPKKVNSAIPANFKVEFKRAPDIKWKKTSDYTKAEFSVNNTKMEVYYNTAGDTIATSKGVTTDDLPVGAKRSFAKLFEGYNGKRSNPLRGF